MIMLLILIFVVPYVLGGSFQAFFLGGLIGFPVGVYDGFKNYFLSIKENITNKKLRIAMMVITVAVAALLLAAVVALFYNKG